MEREPEVERALIDGLTSHGPWLFLAATTAVGAALLTFVVSRLFAEFVCLFELRTAALFHPAGCGSFLFARTDPGHFFLASLIFGAVYMGLFRFSLARRWYVEFGDGIQLHPSHILALAAAPAFLGAPVALAMSGTGTLLRLGWFYTVGIGPLFVLLLGSCRGLVAQLVSKYFKETAAECALQQFLERRLRPEAARGLAVRVGNRRAFVIGPIDEIDAQRIRDIVATSFSEWIDDISIETTLDAEAYTRYRYQKLGPSGYQSPPLRPSPEIPAGWFWAAFLAGVLFLLFLVYQGGVMSWEEFSERVRQATKDAGIPLSE